MQGAAKYQRNIILSSALHSGGRTLILYQCVCFFFKTNCFATILQFADLTEGFKDIILKGGLSLIQTVGTLQWVFFALLCKSSL